MTTMSAIVAALLFAHGQSANFRHFVAGRESTYSRSDPDDDSGDVMAQNERQAITNPHPARLRQRPGTLPPAARVPSDP
jgi:hypothetical protein